MGRYIRLLAISMVACLASCGRAPVAKVAVVARPARPTVKTDDDESHPAQLTLVDFANLRFQSADVKATVARWEQAIKRHARETDILVPWNRYPSENLHVVEWWSDAPQLISPQGMPRKQAYLGKSDFRLLCLTCYTHQGHQPYPEWASVALEQFESAGWGVKFENIAGPRHDKPSLIFIRRGKSPADYQDIELLPGLLRWRQTLTFGEFHYDFLVTLPEYSINPIDQRGPQIEARVRPLSDSAESFRATCQKILDDLEQAVRSKIANDQAIAGVHITERRGGTHGGDPPYEHEKTVERALLADERKVALETALAEISRRRKTIDEHHLALHQALIELFPIHELLGP